MQTEKWLYSFAYEKLSSNLTDFDNSPVYGNQNNWNLTSVQKNKTQNGKELEERECTMEEIDTMLHEYYYEAGMDSTERLLELHINYDKLHGYL